MSVAVNAELHERLGAELSEVDGLVVPLHYGDVAAEVAAARRGVAIVHRSWRALLRVTGDKRTDFLQGMVSNDVVSVASGDGCHTLFLDVKGHVLGDLDFWKAGDLNVIACVAGAADTVLKGLRKYVLAAPVTFDDLRPEETVVGLIGPSAEGMLGELGVVAPPTSAYGHASAELSGVGVRVARTPALAAPGLEFHVRRADLEDVWGVLGDATPRPRPLGWLASEVLRVEAGIPGHGRELTGDEFPQEARVDDAVDYEKGCYLGQETVARIHYRGQVRRLLVGLRLPDSAAAGSELRADDRSVGSVTSAVDSPSQGRIGLGYVRREYIDPGTSLRLVDDSGATREAIVEALPFAGGPPV